MGLAQNAQCQSGFLPPSFFFKVLETNQLLARNWIATASTKQGLQMPRELNLPAPSQRLCLLLSQGLQQGPGGQGQIRLSSTLPPTHMEVQKGQLTKRKAVLLQKWVCALLPCQLVERPLRQQVASSFAWWVRPRMGENGRWTPFGGGPSLGY